MVINAEVWFLRTFFLKIKARQQVLAAQEQQLAQFYDEWALLEAIE